MHVIDKVYSKKDLALISQEISQKSILNIGFIRAIISDIKQWM